MKLTQTVQKGGCAAKVAAAELRSILNGVQFPPAHKELLVDGSDFDDAAIYQISETQAMVQTLDFFTPIVDSPKLFGEIAAANALSDVYAMGGSPKTAMAILGFPLASMDAGVIQEVLQGGSDKIKEANACFVGGHSIDDDTLKFGLSVTGFVELSSIWSNNKSQVGDVLILTKPLGTGTNTAALKRGEVTEADISEVLQSMAQLNRVVDVLGQDERSAIHAATDITGFGLMGHSFQMAKASRVSFDFTFAQIPLFATTMSFLEKGFLTKAHRTNREYTSDWIQIESLSEIQKLTLFDPQTSGGLLLSVSASKAAQVLQKIRTLFPRASVIGEVKAFESSCVRVRS